ncbi:MAG TPA: DUF917 domain-containing protein [Actinomycetota bacterium]|jgi:DUF917 family protein|nr:DUF917 domain-containing protein [Actinomycetota bacterium]
MTTIQRVRQLDESNLRALAVGCAILGAGGGGDTKVGLLWALNAVREHGPVPVVDLDELEDDQLVMPCGGIGAPTVGIEKIDRGDEVLRIRPYVEELWGKPVVALLAAEIGGTNGMAPAAWGAVAGLPVVDADGMGRAFPEVPQVTMAVAGVSHNPAVMTDERGNVVIFRGIDGHWMERMERALAVEFGGQASSSEYQMTVAQAKTATVRGSVSLAVRIGQVLAEAEHDPVAALAQAIDAAVVIAGKVVDVERRTTAGFVRGQVTVEGLGDDAGRTVRLEIQNENLVAIEGDVVHAMVPDIITVIDTEAGSAIQTERVRYGQRVSVIAFPCDPIWRTEAGLALAGPRAFGYDLEYVPVEVLHGGA